MAAVRSLWSVLGAVAILASTMGCAASPLLTAQQELANEHHPAISRVEIRRDWLDGDELHTILLARATDQDARDVWCDLVSRLPKEAASRVYVYAEDREQTRWWDRPKDCTDPDDVPRPYIE